MTKKYNGPGCAGKDQIKSWLEYKVVHLRVLNDKINFSKFNHESVRQNESWLPVVPLRSGIFSDTGYRMRENIFYKYDNYAPWGTVKEQKFYDVELFSSDSIPVTDEYPVLVEMYIRVKVDSIGHSRKVYAMMDWLGSIGGIRDILMEMLSAFFGGYCAFNATLQTFGKMSVLEL